MQDSGWSDLILARGQSILEKGQKRAKRQNKFLGQHVLFGPKFLKFGPKRANLATLTQQPRGETEAQRVARLQAPQRDKVITD